MIVKHYYIEKIAHSSYILAGASTCAVIDPSRDVDIYIKEAQKLGVKITHILETHLHADFVSGHMELARKTGAKIYMPATGGCSFESILVKEGDTFNIEDMKVMVLDTPGHTPEHVSYVVVDESRGQNPVGAFVGDTMFVGDVGRPDLFPNRADELARKLWDSVFNKLLKLPDYCEIYPAHGAGSLCGKSMGAKYTSTIGYEKEYSSILKVKDIDEFVKALTENMPGAPDHFSRSSKLNADGPKGIDEFSSLLAISPNDFSKLALDSNYILVDIRSYHAFGGGHIKGSYSLDASGNLPTFAGWVLPPDKKILYIGESLEAITNANLWLQRVGLDNGYGYLEGGLHSWAASGYDVEFLSQISYDEYVARKSKEDLVLVDSRDANAYISDHIDGAINIPSPELRTRYLELDSDKEIVVICNSGVRSSLGASILMQKGFQRVQNLIGGMQGYMSRKR